MIARAFVFYLGCSVKNRLWTRMKRIRQPRYLVSILAGIGYLLLVFHRQVFSGLRPRSTLAPHPDLLAALESGMALALLAVVLFPWVWPGKGQGVGFTEAEIQFLFPAPISRRSLLRLRIARGQLGILLGAVISVIVFGRGSFFQHPLFLVVALWLIYSSLALYRMGTSLTKTSIAEHGRFGIRYHYWGLGLVMLAAALLLVWMRWFVPAPLRSPGSPDSDLLRWFLQLTSSGPIYFLLLPFRLLVRPAFAPDWLTFALRLPPALIVLAAAYGYAVRSDVGFEEAALARARASAARLEGAASAAASGERKRSKVRRPIFSLKSEGPPSSAILWKNLISIGRLNPIRFIPLAVAISVMVTAALLGGGNREGFLPAAIGTTAAITCLFLTLFGPMLIRDDLRTDLLQVELLKTYPLPGWSVVIGEVLAPILVLTFFEWLLLVAAAWLLPDARGAALSWPTRVLVGAGLAILLPCITGLGVLAQNAAALLLPGWVQLGKEHQRGIEAMGQRMIVLAAVVIVLGIASLPAGVPGLLLLWIGYPLLGLKIVPLAALAAAAIFAAEAAIAVVLLGHAFDDFDASRELDAV